MNETPARRVGRPSEYKPEYCALIVEHMSQGASVLSFCAEIRVCRATITVWCNEYPEFLAAHNIAKMACAAWWEVESRKIAQGKSRGNANMAIFGLANMGREAWKSKQEIDHVSSDGSMTPKPAIDASKLSSTALAELLALKDAADK